MKVVIAQPGLFPWRGTFEKLEKADVWVHLDHVSFQRDGYLHRLRVRDRQGTPRWLTIPIGRQGMGTRIDCVTLPLSDGWRNTLLQCFEEYYRAAEHRQEASGLLSEQLNRSEKLAVELAISSTEIIASVVGVKLPRFERSSTLGVTSKGSLLVAEIVEAVGGSTYVYGPGRRGIEKHYLDLDLLHGRGIETSVMRYAAGERYSILDCVAYGGIRSTRFLGSVVAR